MSNQNKSQFHKAKPQESEQQSHKERKAEAEALEHADTMDAKVVHNLAPNDSKNEFIVVTSLSASQIAHDDDQQVDANESSAQKDSMMEQSPSIDQCPITVNLSMDKISLGATDVPASQAAIPQKMDNEQKNQQSQQQIIAEQQSEQITPSLTTEDRQSKLSENKNQVQ